MVADYAQHEFISSIQWIDGPACSTVEKSLELFNAQNNTTLRPSLLLRSYTETTLTAIATRCCTVLNLETPAIVWLYDRGMQPDNDGTLVAEEPYCLLCDFIMMFASYTDWQIKERVYHNPPAKTRSGLFFTKQNNGWRISGDTFTYRQTLRTEGCQWQKAENSWWHADELSSELVRLKDH